MTSWNSTGEWSACVLASSIACALLQWWRSWLQMPSWSSTYHKDSQPPTLSDWSGALHDLSRRSRPVFPEKRNILDPDTSKISHLKSIGGLYLYWMKAVSIWMGESIQYCTAMNQAHRRMTKFSRIHKFLALPVIKNSTTDKIMTKSKVQFNKFTIDSSVNMFLVSGTNQLFPTKRCYRL